MKAFLASFGKSESGAQYGNKPGKGGTTTWQVSNGGTGYYSVNQIGATGKYQFLAPALETFGFLKTGSSANVSSITAINNPANWSPKYMGCDSAVAFMNNGAAQEACMLAMIQANCKQLTKWGILNSNSSAENVLGWLAVCQLVGSGGALTYYREQNPGAILYGTPTKNYNTSDINGATAASYFAQGSNAAQVGTSVAKV
jgi:hypothetical protein